MLDRWMLACPLAALLLASGCPEPEEEGGAGETLAGETGDGEGEAGDGDGDGEGESEGDGGERDDVGDLRPPLDTGDDDGDGGDGEEGGEDTAGPFDDPKRCWDDTWKGDTLPAVVLGNTIDRVDSSTGTCGFGPAPDYQLGFVAPWAGTFTFDSAGTSFDTVVYIHEGECGDAELACNDDFLALESRVTVELEEAEIVTVSVDGVDALSEGPFKLTISADQPPSCEPVLIVPDLPQLIFGDTTGAPDQLASGCGGVGGPEHVYSFVAPGPGDYRFDTIGSSFDTVLYALDECAGAPLACNDDADFDLQSELILNLEGGQMVLLVVDGFDETAFGSYLLNVESI